jgi:hypothetical protein
LDHLQQAVGFGRVEFAILAEAGVIHQQVDGEGFFLGELENGLRDSGLSQVGNKNL